MEIVRAPEIQPDRDGGKRWPSGRRRGARPPRKPPVSDTPDTGPETAPDDAPATPAGKTTPPASEPAHRLDVTV